MYSLKLGAQNLIVLNKDHAVKDLLDRRGQNYSGRPDVFLRKFGRDLNILMRTYVALPLGSVHGSLGSEQCSLDYRTQQVQYKGILIASQE